MERPSSLLLSPRWVASTEARGAAGPQARPTSTLLLHGVSPGAAVPRSSRLGSPSNNSVLPGVTPSAPNQISRSLVEVTCLDLL